MKLDVKTPLVVITGPLALAFVVLVAGYFLFPSWQRSVWYPPCVFAIPASFLWFAEFIYGRLWPYLWLRYLTAEEIEVARAEYDANQGKEE